MARSTSKRKRTPRPEALVDTGVLLDATSVQGVVLEHGTRGALAPGPDHDSAESRRRRLRTRRALLLLDDFSERKASFVYVGGEAGHLFQKPAPPPRGKDLATSFASFFSGYVLDGQFWGWRAIRDDPAAGRPGDDREAQLVRLAARRDLPIITSEVRKDGPVRREAARRGVKVLSPGEYRAQFIAENAAIERRMVGWEASEEAFFSRARRACRDRRQAIELFGYVEAYLGDVMFDELSRARRSPARP